MSGSCLVCAEHAAIARGDAAASELVAWRGSRWTLRHHPHPSPLAGWMLLDLNRHAQGPADLAGDEAHEFGAVMGAAMRAVRTATGVPRVYSVMFGETAAHLHAHLIPRDPSCAATKAWAVADWYREVARNPELATPRDSIVEMTRAIARAGAHELNLFA